MLTLTTPAAVDLAAYLLENKVPPEVSPLLESVTRKYASCHWAGDSVLFAQPNVDAQAVRVMLERAKSRVQTVFKGQMPRLLVLAFSTQESLWTASETIIGESHGPTAARFVDGVTPLLLLGVFYTEVEPVLVHEFAHATFSVAKLPRWMDEGIALLAEERIYRMPRTVRLPTSVQSPRLSEDCIDRFLGGSLFDDGDLSLRSLAYWNAFLIIRELYQASPEAFQRLCQEDSNLVDWREWMKEHFRLSLLDVRRQLIAAS